MFGKLRLFMLAVAMVYPPASAIQGANIPMKCDISQKMEWEFKYDDQGRLTLMRDPGGKEITVDYEMYPGDQEQLKSVTRRFNGGEIVYEFDRQGRLISMKDLAGIVDYTYDEWGRLSCVKRRGVPAVAYTHDMLDRITSIQVGDFYRIEYAYDFLGRMKSMDTPAGTVKYEYQTGQNEVIRTLPNGVKTFWKRQVNGQLKEITHGYFKHPDDTSGTVLAQYKYAYGPDGRITAIQELSGRGTFIRRYTYDKMGRLISSSGPGGRTYGYSYDLLGNRVKATESGWPDQVLDYDWAGRLKSVNSQPCGYDDSGNLSDVTINGVTRRYRYHPDGRLAEVHANGENVQYCYDGFGRLVSRKTRESKTLFLPDPLSPYWQPLVMDAPGGKLTLVIWDGITPLSLVTGGKPQWLLHDHLNSVRLVMNSKGGVIQYHEYDPFGIIEVPTAKKLLRPEFTGLFWDDLADGYLNLARLYNPHIGKWIQAEPLRFVPSGTENKLSLYGYCGEDPVNYLDLNGFERQKAKQSFIDYINGETIGSYDFDLQLGVGSGVEPVEKILETAEGRFPLIIIWGSKRGPIWDLLRATFLDSAGLARSNIRTVPVSVVDSTEHSAGNYILTLDNLNRNILDPAGYHLSQAEIDIHGIVSDLTSVDLKKPLNNNLFGLSFTGLSDNPFSAGGEAIGDAFRLVRGVATLGARMFIYPVTQKGPFGSHALKPMLNEIADKIPEVNTYDKVDIIYIDDAGNFEKKTYDYPISTNISEDGLRKMTTSPSGVYHYKRPSIDSEWELFQIQENLSMREPSVPGINVQLQKEAKMLADYAMKHIERAHSIIQGHDIGGGVGRVAGPGGFASPGAIAVMEEYRQRSSWAPSTVGGVYLGGAGRAIDGLGVIKGLHIDANNNMVLVAEDTGDVELPPLRLDDVVTVFRSVKYGEGPKVTIDPNPENPEKSAMIIVHSEATKNTYVGWVLYQADRLMKSYTQGVDNKTEKEVVSRVPGYADVLETIYFGGDDPRKSQKKGIWERFWIVPSEARRFEGALRELTLFDVPLKVKTQKMKWVNKKLVDDPKGKSSAGALAFTSWFTGNYDDIALEQHLLPPRECGITEPVPVFTELRRIALMTAIAEKLRDQGVPMPFWMRDYEVRRVPFEQFTPGLKVTRKKRENNKIRTARIFGGVELSADSTAVKTYATSADVANTPPEKRNEVGRSFKMAQHLEKVILDKVSPAKTAPLSLQRFMDDKKQYQAVSVPGAESLALNPCRLAQVDLLVPLPGGRSIQLVRKYNSFFNPKGLWGKGWTMDLPRLEQVIVPIHGENGKVKPMIGYELVTPLNSTFARFGDIGTVKDLGGAQLLVPEEPGPFYGLADDQPDFLRNVNTRVAWLKNGQKWHFTQNGLLVAIVDGPQTTIFERESDGRIPRILGRLNGASAAQIDLEYTNEGTILKAKGRSFSSLKSNPMEVSFAYDDAGRLEGRVSEQGKVGFGYKDSLVTSVTWTEKRKGAKTETLQAFEYNEQGQLVNEKHGTREIKLACAPVSGGAEAVIVEGSDENVRERVRYDDRMRPVETTDSDGTHTQWTYKDNGTVEMIVTMPDNSKVVVTDSADGRKRKVSADGLPTFEATYNAGGKLESYSTKGEVLLKQTWRKDGQLAKAETKWQEVLPQYSDKGLLEKIILRPPNAGKKDAPWQETSLNCYGAAREVSDHTDLHLQLEYDDDGALSAALQKTPEGNFGFRVKRDDKGRLETIDSSWGKLKYDYGKVSGLEKISIKRGDKTAFIEIQEGSVKRRVDFDGGETLYTYNQGSEAQGLLQRVTLPNKLTLSYKYDASGQLSKVAVGKLRCVELSRNKQGRITGYAWKPLGEL